MPELVGTQPRAGYATLSPLRVCGLELHIYFSALTSRYTKKHLDYDANCRETIEPGGSQVW